MRFEYEPSGINDTYLRLTRNGASCILTPGGAWNGLLRVNYLVAGTVGGREPHLIFRALDIGWDDGRFYWKGKAAPVMVSSAMVDVLLERRLLTDGEAEALVFGTPDGGSGDRSDESLMLKAMLRGCAFAPVYDTKPDPFAPSGPPPLTGFALRTLSGPTVHVLDARDGVPVLTPDARAALQRDLA